MSGFMEIETNEADVDDELVEDAAGKLGGDVEADRPEVVGVVEGVGSPCGEREEVIERKLLRRGEVLDGGVLVVCATEIHVSCRSTRRVEAEVEEGAVYVRRAYANGRVWHVKTRRSMRGVPLQGMALQAPRRLPANPNSPLVFSNARDGYIDLHNFRQRHWRPALKAPGIEPLRQPYDLRHTYATFALRAGLSAFALSRYMGTSLAMIDLHYGHLASDGREHAVALLDALAREKLVDAGWTPPPAPANPHGDKPRATRRRTQTHRRGRSVDVTRTTRRRRPDERRR